MSMIKANNIMIKRKWIALFTFLIFMALSLEMIEYVRLTYGVYPTFFETISEQVNEPQLVLFPLMYVLLLFSIDVKVRIEDKKTPFQLLKRCFCSTALYIIFFITANLLCCLLFLDIKTCFNNVWSYTDMLFNTHLSPLAATSVSLLLLFMRSSFLLYLISLINTLTRKNHWGFWSVFVISFIDFWLYDMLSIEYPLGILPLEHTRIVYTEALIPDFENTATRIPYFTSVLYWVGLIVIIYFVLVLVYKRRRSNEKQHIH